MSVNSNILKLQHEYKARAVETYKKAQLIFPLHQQEKLKQRELLDQYRVYKMIYQILSIPNTDMMLKNIETNLKNTSIPLLRTELKKLMKRFADELIPDVDYVGITELSDPSTNDSWIARLKPKMNIIVTKNIAPIIPILLQNKHRIILHATCTGLGKTYWEPDAPLASDQLGAIRHLISLGFPVRQIVGRLDPVILGDKEQQVQDVVIDYFAQLGIKRLRYSFLDQYPAVKQRMHKQDIPTAMGFTYSLSEMQQYAGRLVEKWGSSFHLESCAENNMHQQGCISQMDIDALIANAQLTGANVQNLMNLQLIGSKSSRRYCQCPLNKFELMRAVPGQCPMHCLYCYWNDLHT